MIPDAALGAIAAAIIGAVISLLSLIISKENKISEFRQEWINEFRKDIASAISNVSTINILFSANNQDDIKSEYINAWKNTSNSLALIELRLNIKEENHLALQGMIRETEDLIRNGESGQYNQSEAESLQDRVVALTQIILKDEWDRVRKGETTFQNAKNIASVSIALVFILFGFFLLLSITCKNF